MGIGKSATVAQSSSLFLLVDQIHSGKKYLRTKVCTSPSYELTKVRRYTSLKIKLLVIICLSLITCMCINNTKVVFTYYLTNTYITHTYGINNSNPPPLYFGLPPGNANETRIFTAYGENPF